MKSRKGNKRVKPSSSEEEEDDQEEVSENEVVREELSEEEDEEAEIDENDNEEEEDEEDDEDDFLDDQDDDEDDVRRNGQDDEESASEGDEEMDEFEDGGEEARLTAIGSAKFADAMKALLAVSEDGTPTTEPTKLFQRKTKLMKMEETEKVEKLKLKKQQAEKNKFDMKNVVMLPETDPAKINAERDLKRIATRGVVALFNAIGAHQRASAATAASSIGDASKESFLKLLAEKATGKIARPEEEEEGEEEAGEEEDESLATKMAQTSGWKVLQEDYLENEDEVESDDGKDEDNHAVDSEEEEDSE